MLDKDCEYLRSLLFLFASYTTIICKDRHELLVYLSSLVNEKCCVSLPQGMPGLAGPMGPPGPQGDDVSGIVFFFTFLTFMYYNI